MQTIIVDMTPGFRMPTIYYSQGDVGTQFAIDLRSRFGDSFPTGTTVTIQATKPSGFGFSVAATSVTNGVATFTTTAEMTDEFGRFPAELKVTKTGLTLFTANFYMDGERNTHPEGTTDGSQETVIPELTQLVERVEDAASSVLDMTVVANTLPAGSDATYSYDEETNTATFGIPKGADGSLASGVLAPTYSSSSTYAVGDYVYYSGSLYRCTTAITTAEAWTSGHWTQVALAPEVSDLKSEINQAMELGALASGVDSPNTSAVRSKGFVYAPSGTRLRAIKYNNTNFNVTVCQYDENKTFLTGQNLTINSTTSATTGSNTKYIRYFFWAVPALVDAVTDADLVTFASLVTVTLPKGVSENRNDIDEIKASVHSAPITSVNYSTLLPDLNDVSANSVYRLVFALDATTIPAHTPFGAKWGSATAVLLITTVKTKGAHNGGDHQLFISENGIYERQYSSAWEDWKLILSDNVAEIYSTLLNGTSVVSDLNNVNKNIVYRFNFALNATSIPANTPYVNGWKSNCVAFFQSIVKAKGTHSAGDQQIFIGSDGVYTRFYGASWSGWYHVADKDPNTGITITVDANGGGDYTSLCEALKEATENHTNAYVYVKRGTYDAIAEMKDIHGDDYFDNLPSGMTSGMVYLKNGVKVYCEPGTKMTCNYTGNTENVNIYFAPINCDASDCTLENLTIEASNVRYCIHDDQWDKTSPYKRLFKNLTLIMDNTNNENWDRRQAFGGGLGVNGYIEFDDCYFKAEGLDGSAYTGYASCSYHNSPSEGAQSKIVINNCYFADNSTFALTYYGQSTLITQAFVSGCSLGHAMQTGGEGPLAQIDNVEIVDCNNVIRS